MAQTTLKTQSMVQTTQYGVQVADQTQLYIMKVDNMKIAMKVKNKATLVVKVLKLSIGVQVVDQFS